MKKSPLLNISLVLLFLLSLTACQKRGCTDPNALNYDASAVKDAENCEYEQFDKQGLLQNLNTD